MSSANVAAPSSSFVIQFVSRMLRSLSRSTRRASPAAKISLARFGADQRPPLIVGVVHLLHLFQKRLRSALHVLRFPDLLTLRIHHHYERVTADPVKVRHRLVLVRNVPRLLDPRRSPAA